MLIKKHPSAAVNPANQFGLGIFVFATIGLSKGVISGKAAFKLLGKPRFTCALIAKILLNPSLVKCSLF